MTVIRTEPTTDRTTDLLGTETTTEPGNCFVVSVSHLCFPQTSALTPSLAAKEIRRILPKNRELPRYVQSTRQSASLVFQPVATTQIGPYSCQIRHSGHYQIHKSSDFHINDLRLTSFESSVDWEIEPNDFEKHVHENFLGSAFVSTYFNLQADPWPYLLVNTKNQQAILRARYRNP